MLHLSLVFQSNFKTNPQSYNLFENYWRVYEIFTQPLKIWYQTSRPIVTLLMFQFGSKMVKINKKRIDFVSELGKLEKIRKAPVVYICLVIYFLHEVFIIISSNLKLCKKDEVWHCIKEGGHWCVQSKYNIIFILVYWTLDLI